MEHSINIDINISIDGMGIIFYSDSAVKNIVEGEDYLTNEYEIPELVGNHIRKGDIVGFCTGSSGEYSLKFRSGQPSNKLKEEYPIGIYLGIVINGGRLCVKDLFWLMDWNPECPDDQQFNLDDGVYEMRVHTARPKSGFYGDNQTIYVYLNKVDKMPQLPWNGVPQLFKDF
ncbi:hypothetical protein [Clostridium sp. HMSC19A10]|uniref:hypothetical protein n=1 Tax=Clostridium TaxID=1485 RepID=UPI0008A220F7|nr:hypothetical protein [Clostridium sp. HMSC19A10]OFS24193.1 hypothetical protein HMPREF3070_05900 [Clostridium sp. HMSC19A10]